MMPFDWIHISQSSVEAYAEHSKTGFGMNYTDFT
jgi:hypothetical protein